MENIILVNYNDTEWINHFITEILTEEDYKKHVDFCNEEEPILDKLGYKEVKVSFQEKYEDEYFDEVVEYNRTESTFIFINESGKLEEDVELEKYHKYILDNPEFKSRCKEAFYKY